MSKVAVVTGAACGFGFEFSKILAGDSYDLIMIDIDSRKLDNAKDYILDNYKVDVLAEVADLSRPETVHELYDKIAIREPSILINNAGIGLVGLFCETDWDTEMAMINLHIVTVTALTKLFIRDMIKRGEGRIMNVASLAAIIPGPLMSVYYGTKAYLLSFSAAIANELKGTGVTVTALCPGTTRTGFQEATAMYSGCKENDSSLFTASINKVVNCGYRAMLKGRVRCIPGIRNKILYGLCCIVPYNQAVTIMRKIQESIRK